MKTYVLTLTDEATEKPEVFVSQLERDLAAQGAGNFVFLPAIGVVHADFENPPNLAGVRGVLACEESQECFTQAGSN
jgi:hypothetical protein